MLQTYLPLDMMYYIPYHFVNCTLQAGSWRFKKDKYVMATRPLPNFGFGHCSACVVCAEHTPSALQCLRDLTSCTTHATYRAGLSVAYVMFNINQKPCY